VRLALAQWEREQEEMARLQSTIDRFGAKTMGAKMAQDRYVLQILLQLVTVKVKYTHFYYK
jgi:ABC transporter